MPTCLGNLTFNKKLNLMKNTLLFLCLFTFSFIACKDKSAESTKNTELQETIKKLETENVELKKLDNEINTDVKELDQLLKEMDEIK